MLEPVNSCDRIATKPCKSVGFTCDSVATAASALPACPFHRKSLLDELTARGVRLTSQRRAVVEVIQDSDRHLDAASLLHLAQKKQANIDRATVYRTLELLKKLRLIDELDLMHLKGEKHYYEVKTRREHVHLACFSCGRIEEISSALFERLKEQIAIQADFELQVSRLEIGGLCSTCRQQEFKPKEIVRGIAAAS